MSSYFYILAHYSSNSCTFYNYFPIPPFDLHVYTPLLNLPCLQMIGFLDNLCGARQSELKINEPDKLGFDPRKLVSNIASVIINIWILENGAAGNKLKPDGFTISFVEHPDFSRPAMNKVNAVLQRHQLCPSHVLTGYTSFLENVC